MNFFDTEEDLKHGDSAKCYDYDLKWLLDINLELIIICLEDVSQYESKMVSIMLGFRFN